MPDALTLAMPSDREIQVTRSFNAPAQLVWDAHTRPELVQRWLLGPDGWSMPICEIDFRIGGAYRYGWKNDASGQAFEMSGVFKDIAPLTRIVHSERFGEDESLVTMTFAEARGQTTMILVVRYASKETRDAAFATGMTEGMEQSYRRLDALAAAAA